MSFGNLHLHFYVFFFSLFHFLGKFYSSIDAIFTGFGGFRLCSVQRGAAATPASCPHPRHCVQIRGLFGSPSKPSGRGHGAVCVAWALEAVLGLLSLGTRPSGNRRTLTGCLGSAVPHPPASPSQGLRKLAVGASWVVPGSCEQFCLCFHGMVTRRGWTEAPQLQRQRPGVRRRPVVRATISTF